MSMKARLLRIILIVLVAASILIGPSMYLFHWRYGQKAFLYRLLPMMGVSLCWCVAVHLFYHYAPSVDRRRFGFMTVIICALHGLIAAILTGVVSGMATKGKIDGTLYWCLLGGQCFLQYLANIHVVVMSQPKLRGTLYNLVIGCPATFHLGSCVLALVALPIYAGLPVKVWLLPIPCLPYIIAGAGVMQSLHNHAWEEIVVNLGESYTGRPGRGKDKMWPRPQRLKVPRFSLRSGSAAPSYSSIPDPSGGAKQSTGLRIIQITDPHLGVFMSIERLHSVCQKIVDMKPDLVLLTGDFHCPDGDHTPDSLTTALQPLTQLRGKVFACLGNHDKESKRILEDVQRDMITLGIPLLVDASVCAETRLGRVHILGLDFVYTKHGDKIPHICGANPVPQGCVLSIILLHDPKGFKYIPQNRESITFCGHTHGGHIGLFSFGLPWTLVGLITGVPDHGVWGLGRNLCYVHRGQGFRSLTGNMVPRIGVPNENSVVVVRTPALMSAQPAE